MKILICIVLCLPLISCGGGSDSAEFSDSYDFTYNGCNTGKHSFSASTVEGLKEKVCAALVDESLNKGCAIELRAQKFNSDCN